MPIHKKTNSTHITGRQQEYQGEERHNWNIAWCSIVQSVHKVLRRSWMPNCLSCHLWGKRKIRNHHDLALGVFSSFTVYVKAMWDHGCDFGNNLSAQNITWGDFRVVSWSFCFRLVMCINNYKQWYDCWYNMVQDIYDWVNQRIICTCLMIFWFFPIPRTGMTISPNISLKNSSRAPAASKVNVPNGVLPWAGTSKPSSSFVTWPAICGWPVMGQVLWRWSWVLNDFDLYHFYQPSPYHSWSVEFSCITYFFFQRNPHFATMIQWPRCYSWPLNQRTKVQRPAAAIAARRIRRVHSRRVSRATSCATACWLRTPTLVVERSQHFQERRDGDLECSHLQFYHAYQWVAGKNCWTLGHSQMLYTPDIWLQNSYMNPIVNHGFGRDVFDEYHTAVDGASYLPPPLT